MLRVNPRVFSAALFSALGLAPLACGGASTSTNGDGGDAGSSPGGTKASGGTNAAAGQSTGGSKSTGGTKGVGGSSNTGGSASAGAPAFPCLDPLEIGGGYEQCGGSGPIHRPVLGGECPSQLPRADAKIALPAEGSCAVDTDCADQPHGYCSVGGELAMASCHYGCVKDSECGAGNICVCGEPVGHCASAACTSDADCGGSFRCQSYDASPGCGQQSFACQTADDTCASDADCAGNYCVASWSADTGLRGSFACQTAGCSPGRPFLVAGELRVAPLALRSDWLQSTAVDLEGVPARVREAAALAWARNGQLEHASVAAFARFALQLLSLGAPAQLIELTTQAMADETRHAQLAFGLASALSGKSLGPAALDVENSLLETSLVEVVRLVIREGCIGETGAALEAREAAEHAQDQGLARLLRGVADDESRHAELAWRFVSWALARDFERVAPVLQSELARATHQTPAPTARASADELAVSAFGILPEPLRLELQKAAFREVIAPCAVALLRRAAGYTPEYPVLSA